MVNWNNLFNVLGNSTIVSFATGELSWNGLEKQARKTNVAGEVRTLLRKSGVNHARRLARKAVSRRGLNG